MKSLATLALLACLPFLAACQRDAAPPAASGEPSADGAPQTALGRTVAKAMDEARKQLREGDLSLNGDYDVRVNGKRLSRKTGDLPPAHIAPDGQLVVDGKTIAMDDAARAVARDYREGLIAVAEAGMDIGVQGADLGMKAAGEAIGSLFRGDTDEVEKRIEAEAKRLEASALRLCERLPALLSAQQALAAAVPEFVPYARMEARDIDDCRDRRDSVDAEIAAHERTAVEESAAPDAGDARR